MEVGFFMELDFFYEVKGVWAMALGGLDELKLSLLKVGYEL